MALITLAAAGPNDLFRRTTCSTPDGSGICVDTRLCGGFSVPGYCRGPDDIQCCISETCSTPSGSGTCKNTSNDCSGGSFIAGYCPGPDDIGRRVKSSGDIGGNLPGIHSVQTMNARAIIAQNNKDGLGRKVVKQL